MRKLAGPPRFDKTVDDTWNKIGCDADGAPYVMSRLISRLSNYDEKVAAGIATQFLDKECQGRKGLSADDLARLQEIAKPRQQP